MSPLGKFTLALLGLRFFGAEGFFVGIWLGHMLVDRTLVIKKLEKYLSMVDDNIRLVLPYKFYHYYNRIDGNFWGKIWGAIIGSTLWGVNGFIVFFIIGHFVFDTPNSRHARRFRKTFDELWDKNWAKIGGAIAGFVCHSRLLLFCGVITGFFVDYYRLEKADLFPFQRIKKFWYRINPLKLWRHSREARHVAYIRAMAGLAAKVAKADGQVSENEIKVFKKIFVINDEENSQVARVFNEAKKNSGGFERFAEQLNWLTTDNLNLKENALDSLFKIATADGALTGAVLEILHKTARIIEFPEGNFEVLEGMYKPRATNSPLQDFYDILGVMVSASDCEIKRRWKELIVKHHPDLLQANGANAAELEAATSRLAEINNAYQTIMKARSVS